jgi:hypothetical protein
VRIKLVVIALFFMPTLVFAETTKVNYGEINNPGMDMMVDDFQIEADNLMTTCKKSIGPQGETGDTALTFIAREIINTHDDPRKALDQLVALDRRISEKLLENQKLSNEVLEHLNTLHQFSTHSQLALQMVAQEKNADQVSASLKHHITQARIQADKLRAAKKFAKVSGYGVDSLDYNAAVSIEKQRGEQLCAKYNSLFNKVAEAQVGGYDDYFTRQQTQIIQLAKVCKTVLSDNRYGLCF